MPPGQLEAKLQKRKFGKQPKNGESSPPPGHMEGTEPSSHEKMAFAAETTTSLENWPSMVKHLLLWLGHLTFNHKIVQLHVCS